MSACVTDEFEAQGFASGTTTLGYDLLIYLSAEQGVEPEVREVCVADSKGRMSFPGAR